MTDQLSRSEAQDLLAIAQAATAVSKDVLESGWRIRDAPVSKVGRDIKLPQDLASEQLIRSFLAERSNLPILGEEQGWSGSQGQSALYWAIDPLDGSYNYHRGVPLYAVSVALCRDRDPILGAIRDPRRDETFAGGSGLGLFCNNAPIRSGPVAREILATGFPVRADIGQATSRLGNSAKDFNKVRMIGSAALSLAWVAAGRFDAYEEDGIMWWDVAAGLALAASTGCAVEFSGDLDGPLLVSVRR